jgi:hypothetical protein
MWFGKYNEKAKFLMMTLVYRYFLFIYGHRSKRPAARLFYEADATLKEKPKIEKTFPT